MIDVAMSCEMRNYFSQLIFHMGMNKRMLI